MTQDETTEIISHLRMINAALRALVAQTRREAPKAIADDADLDGAYGDPEVKFMPRDWKGDNYKGTKMSACPADLLDMLAQTFDYFADKAEAGGETTNSGKPVAPYKRKDAARARGWAKRVREGRVPSRDDSGDGAGVSEWPDPGF